MMKFKNIELNGTYKVVYFDASFAIYDEKGRQIYYENSDGDWAKWEYDDYGATYYEDSDGEIFDKRVKELTVKQIEKLLGYKIKVKGE